MWQIIFQRDVVQRKPLLFEHQIATWRFQSSLLSPTRSSWRWKGIGSTHLDSTANWRWRHWDMWHAYHPFTFFCSAHLTPFILSSPCFPFSCHSWTWFFFFFCYSLLSFFKKNKPIWIADSDTAVSRNNSLPTLENKLSHHNPKRFIAYCASDRATTNIQVFFNSFLLNADRSQRNLTLCLQSFLFLTLARERWHRVNPWRYTRVHDLWDPSEWLGFSRLGGQRQRKPVQGEPRRLGHLRQIHY